MRAEGRVPGMRPEGGRGGRGARGVRPDKGQRQIEK
jgi:hypothetical protein